MAVAQYSELFWFPSGALAANVSARVFEHSTNTLATLWADASGTVPLANPISTSAAGRLEFWAEEGRYWIHIDSEAFDVAVGAAAQTASVADVNTAVATHNADTTDVHGIADTAVLETEAGAQGKADAAQAAATTAAASDATSKVAAHAAASDPHGDRAYADTSKLAKSSNLSDLGNAGTARSNLGLGGAATLSVGTSAGTVAAGDDSRITGAVQSSDVPFTAGVYSPSRRLPKWPQPSLILTQFQSGHGFTNNAGSTYTANDTSDFIVGTQAAKIVTGGTGAAANVSKTGMSAFDTTGKVVRLRLKVDDITHVAGINLFLGNTSFANTYKWIIQGGAAGSNLITSGEWVTVTLNWHDATTTGSPTRSGLTDVRLQITDDGTAPVTAHYQSVELIPDASSVFPNGVVSICFDDCWQSVWDLGKPRLDLYGYPATMYTIQDVLGVSTRLTLAELYHLQDRCGWEIASHAYTDADHALSYTGMTAAQLDTDLRALKGWTLASGFRGGDGTAYPLGQYGLTTDAQSTTNVLRRYFNYARTTHSRTKETFPPGDPYRLRAISSISSFSGGYAPTSLTTATTGDLDKCKANQTWLILVFHKISSGAATDTSTCSQSDFNSIIDAINAKSIPVIPVGDVLKYYG